MSFMKVCIFQLKSSHCKWSNIGCFPILHVREEVGFT